MFSMEIQLCHLLLQGQERRFMWFGTVSGLNRYDGYQFKTYEHDPWDSNFVADNYIEKYLRGVPTGNFGYRREGTVQYL